MAAIIMGALVVFMLLAIPFPLIGILLFIMFIFNYEGEKKPPKRIPVRQLSEEEKETNKTLWRG